MRRRDVLLSGAAAALWPMRALGQETRPRLVAAIIGAPGPTDPTAIAWAEAVKLGLRQQGWIEGDNLRFEVRFTAGERALVSAYTAEMYALGPDIFVTGTTENAMAVHGLTQDTPLVFVAVPDPIAAGLVASYARPGGHATGVTHLEPSVGGVMVDLLMQVAPDTTRVVFFTNPDSSETPAYFHPFVAAAAASHGIGFSELLVRAVDEVGPAVDAIAEEPGIGFVLPPNNWVHNNGSYFVDAINRHRIPAIYPSHRMVEAGGLISVGVEIIEMFRLGGEYAGRIMNGTSPSDLPVQAAPFSTLVNLRTAAAHGITIPLSMLATADRFIE